MSGMMRNMRNTADPLRQQMFQIGYAQAPQLYVTQYLQPNLHLYLAHNSGLASFANNTFFSGLFTKRHLQLRQVSRVVGGLM